jgi:hypothetical protein
VTRYTTRAWQEGEETVEQFVEFAFREVADVLAALRPGVEQNGAARLDNLQDFRG